MEGPGNKLEDGKSGNYFSMPCHFVLETFGIFMWENKSTKNSFCKKDQLCTFESSFYTDL